MKNRKWPTGFIFLAYNILYSIGRFSLGFLRGGSPRYLFDLTAGQLTSMAVITLSAILIGFFYLKSNNKMKQMIV